MIKPVIDFTSTWVQSLFIGGGGELETFWGSHGFQGDQSSPTENKGGGGTMEN